MAYVNYSGRLTDPRWQKKRLEVFSRDNFKCTLCENDKIELHVHHKEYITGCEPWEYDLSKLQTLCKTCHTVVEWLKKQGEFVLSSSIILGDDGYDFMEIITYNFLNEITVHIGEIKNNQYVHTLSISEAALKSIQSRLIKVKMSNISKENQSKPL